MTARLATQARILEAVQSDHDRASDLALTLWRTAQSLAVMPSGALSLPHVRQSIIEAQEVLQRALDAASGEVGRG